MNPFRRDVQSATKSEKDYMVTTVATLPNDVEAVKQDRAAVCVAAFPSASRARFLNVGIVPLSARSINCGIAPPFRRGAITIH
jgi:hypothetical protein